MRSSVLTAQAAVLALLLLVICPVEGRFTYQDRIPNGRSVIRNGIVHFAVGHFGSAGGGARNPFGTAFALNGLAWSAALCQADSDGDGFTNGMELGDPDCVWAPGATPSRTTDITHPGFADSFPGAVGNIIIEDPAPPTTDRTTVLASGETGTVDGFLLDTASAQLQTFMDDPNTYTVNHAKIASLSSSLGWTIVIKLPGDAEYHPYYNLTSQSAAVATTFFFRRPDEHNNHAFLRVYAEGTQQSNGEFNATAIYGAEVTVTGLLVDLFCIDRINALDGTNMLTEPTKHTKHCLLLADCRPGGYSLLLNEQQTDTVYGPLYNFTGASNALSEEFLDPLAERQNDIIVTLRGRMNSHNQFEIRTLDGPSPILLLWQIIVIAVACLVVVIIALVVLCKCCCCKSKKKETVEVEKTHSGTGAQEMVVTPTQPVIVEDFSAPTTNVNNAPV